MSTKRKLNLISPVGYTGYGVAGFNFLKTLTEREWDIYLFGKDVGARTNPEEKNKIIFAQAASNYFDYNAPCLNIWHQHDLSAHVGYGKYIAFPFFELDRFDPREIHHLEFPHKLCVASQWAKDVLLSNNISYDENIHVVNLGVDLDIFNPSKSTYDHKNTIFLNAGKWEIRKGHDVLVEIFNEAFSEDDNVELWLMAHNAFLSASDRKNWEDLYLESKLGRAGKIKILPWQRTHYDVANIMAQVDCGVFPSRAEGWNLELLEMMALGKPVIATNYSSHTEFCNKDNCMLIDIDEMEPAYDGKFFFEQGDWAALNESQIEQCVEYMQMTYKYKQSPGKFTNDAGVETGSKYTWDRATDQLEKILLDNS